MLTVAISRQLIAQRAALSKPATDLQETIPFEPSPLAKVLAHDPATFASASPDAASLGGEAGAVNESLRRSLADDLSAASDSQGWQSD